MGVPPIFALAPATGLSVSSCGARRPAFYNPLHLPLNPSRNYAARLSYVKSFIRKYGLNEAQQNRAWAIYRDVKAYGDKLRARAAKKTAGLKGERAKADESRRSSIDRQIKEADEPVRRVFGQMKRRLDRLPTRAQRRNAETSKEGKSGSSRKKANRRADGP